MIEEKHYAALVEMYAEAPINEYYQPTLEISEARAEVSIEVTGKMHHALGAMHGSVYFKLLDDAAYFAANSVEPTFFVLTADFRVDLLRPFIAGRIRAVGTVVRSGRLDILAESKLYDEQDRLLATGVGRFSRGRARLMDIPAYFEKLG